MRRPSHAAVGEGSELGRRGGRSSIGSSPWRTLSPLRQARRYGAGRLSQRDCWSAREIAEAAKGHRRRRHDHCEPPRWRSATAMRCASLGHDQARSPRKIAFAAGHRLPGPCRRTLLRTSDMPDLSRRTRSMFRRGDPARHRAGAKVDGIGDCARRGRPSRSSRVPLNSPEPFREHPASCDPARRAGP